MLDHSSVVDLFFPRKTFNNDLKRHCLRIVKRNNNTIRKQGSSTKKIFILSWNLLNARNHQGLFLKNMVCSVGDQLLGGDFDAVMDKTQADRLQITKN